MDAIFSWVGAALGALFVVAVAVAWWEHLSRQASAKLPPAPTSPRAVSVDVSLDSLAEAAAAAPSRPTGDAAERQAALDSAISRMALPANAELAWTETTPMVLHPVTTPETPTAPEAESPAPART